MPEPKDYSWIVEYDGDPSSPLSETFTSLRYTQSFTNMLGMAEHYFCLSNITGGSPGYEVIPPELESRKTLKFKIRDVSGEQTQEWEHLVYDYDLLSSRRKGWRLVIRTVEMGAKMHLEEKNRAHRLKAFTQSPPSVGIVETIVGENGFSPDEEYWEGVPVIPEHKVLRQINLTDYQFLVTHVFPRMNRGVYLYTNDGKKFNCHSAGFSATTYNPDPLLYHDVREHNRVFAAIKMGGSKLKVTGYDPLLKNFLAGEKGPDVEPSFGSDGPLHEGNRTEVSFLTQEQSVEWWAENRNRWQAYRGYTLNIPLRGHFPEDTEGWKGPIIMDTGGFSHREPDSQTGYLASCVHDVRNGKYEVTASCLRTKIN